ncbi:hypothetical protein DdX_19385 [Ditylenchus destructor]|uniref:Uncharacterized protein n=1 Tax=Ditylenchus destructor TaxID=166010 RepID=A0AAD4MI24_9BILA|nr:hypothetical protein DdX_19385 [Ditylenchus destructor]
MDSDNDSDNLSCNSSPSRNSLPGFSKLQIKLMLERKNTKPVLFFENYKDHFSKIFHDANGDESEAIKTGLLNYIVCKYCGELLQLKSEHHKRHVDRCSKAPKKEILPETGKSSIKSYFSTQITATDRKELTSLMANLGVRDSSSPGQFITRDNSSPATIHHLRQFITWTIHHLRQFITYDNSSPIKKKGQFSEKFDILGRRPKDKRKKYKDADKRILKILQEYQRNERTVIELLRGIAQNIVIDDVVGIDDEVENNE